MLNKNILKQDPLIGLVASVSVGLYKGQAVLDLDYVEDSNADTDMNVVMTQQGGFVEIQGTAEGTIFTREQNDLLLNLAEKGIRELITAQQRALRW